MRCWPGWRGGGDGAAVEIEADRGGEDLAGGDVHGRTEHI